MNEYAKFVSDNYDLVRKFPTHQRFKELAKMWQARKKTGTSKKEAK